MTVARSALAALIMVTVPLAGCMSGSSAEFADNPTEPCGALDQGFDLEAAEPYDPRVKLVTSKGTVEMVVYLEQVPVTAGLFLENVAKGVYDGTRFHHLQEDSFVQGGDPNSAGDDKRRWGTGGKQSMPNEFHQHLRHDQPGTVSVAGQSPNTGGTQFVITLESLPGLDDQQEVFARVTDGLGAVRDISRTETDQQNRPTHNAWLHDAQILRPKQDASNATASLSSYGFDCTQAAEPGGTAEYLMALRNTGQRVVNGTFSAETPGGNWSVDLRETDRVPLPSGQTRAQAVDVRVPADAEPGSYEVNVTVEALEGDAATTRTLTVNVGDLGDSPSSGDAVALDYVGMLEDARVIDTTQKVYTEEPSLSWFHPRPPATEPVEVTLGESPFPQGLENLTTRAKAGQSVVAAIPPSEAYGANSWGQTGLGGRLLYFQVHVHAGDVDAAEIPSRGPGP